MPIINAKLPKALEIACAKGVTPGLWADILDPYMALWGINKPRRIAAFIGQLAVESAGFTVMQEDLYYSAERLCQVWPSRFPAPAGVASYCAHNPERLANEVYCGRMGNGDIFSGDGYIFRGAGLIQLTGRNNHTKFAEYAKMPVEQTGDYLRTPRGAAESAAWAWANLFNNLNNLADGWFITSISRQINGGSEGLQPRIDMSNKVLKGIGA